jgi:hypothetical protein
MSNFQEWDDDDFDFEDEDVQARQPKDNDSLIKQLRKAERSKDKQLKELQAQLNEFKSLQRETTVKSVLESKGLSPKVAKLLPADLEPTAEAVDGWLSEFGDVFGIQQSAPVEQPSLAALRQIDQVTAGAVTPDKIEDMLLRLDQAQSQDEIINMIYGQN